MWQYNLAADLMDTDIDCCLIPFSLAKSFGQAS